MRRLLPVALAVMPEGVEHLVSHVMRGEARQAVALAVMPEGVEHSTEGSFAARTSQVALAVMPEGVEHC